ncbi:MAG: AMP-binding protein [Steroidobacteraceae bacterium]|nr:AMP-binding protein [Steroidobacteraceae bacterium]
MQQPLAPGAVVDKIWLKNYPPGVPAEIDVNECESLQHLFDGACRQYAAKPAFSNMGRTLTYAEVDAAAERFGAWLQNEAGMKKGDRLAIMMPNLLQYPIAIFGALRAGLTIVNTNPLYTHRELVHQLNDSGASAIVIFDGAAATLAEAMPDTPKLKHVIVTGVGDLLGFPKGAIVNFALRHVKKMVPAWNIPGAHSFTDVVARGGSLKLDKVPLGHDDIAFLQYTGGTTGVSKAAILTHRNLIANALQCVAWMPSLRQLDPTVITALPLYHIFALTTNCLLFLFIGGHNVLITNPRDMKGFVKELARVKFTFITGVNTLYNGLLHTPGFEKIDFSTVMGAMGGGMAVQAAVSERWRKATGRHLVQGWGLTETSPVVTVNRLDETEFTGSIGYPMPSTELSVRDDDGNELPIGQVGELCARGPQVMSGYWNRPDETAKVMLPGGWLRTGDIGRMDEKGLSYIEDRKKDMILVSGFNVYPNEVEGVVAKMPQVREVAAVAQNDERSGEVVALFVVKNDPTLTAEQIIEFCRGDLTGYKVPKFIYFRDELPKTNVGKILRRDLRDELRKQHPAS